jgi:hypothetical protein
MRMRLFKLPRKRILFPLVGLSGLFAAFVLWPRPDRITAENIRRIHKGMARADVEAILGLPGDYRTGPTNPDTSLVGKPPFMDISGDHKDTRDTAELDEWKGDTALILLEFDGSDHLAQGLIEPAIRVEQGPLENLLWRAKRKWQGWAP